MFSELNSDTLDQFLGSHSKVMVQYGAGWCGNCKITKPKFKRLAETHTDIEFVYVTIKIFSWTHLVGIKP